MLAITAMGWLLFFIPSGVVWLIAFVAWVIYLTRTDEQFHDTYVLGERDWF